MAKSKTPVDDSIYVIECILKDGSVEFWYDDDGGDTTPMHIRTYTLDKAREAMGNVPRGMKARICRLTFETVE